MRILRWPLAASLAICLGYPAFAQTAETNGTTTLVEQYALTKDSDLAFGAVLPPTSGTNTVAIDEDDGLRAISGAGNGALIGGGTSRATYTVEGDGGQTFDINIPANFNITRSGGTETIPVTLVPTALGGTLSGTSGNAGTATFGVGGNFPVTSTTPIGFYVGTFLITIENN